MERFVIMSRHTGEFVSRFGRNKAWTEDVNDALLFTDEGTKVWMGKKSKNYVREFSGRDMVRGYSFVVRTSDGKFLKMRDWPIPQNKKAMDIGSYGDHGCRRFPGLSFRKGRREDFVISKVKIELA